MKKFLFLGFMAVCFSGAAALASAPASAPANEEVIDGYRIVKQGEGVVYEDTSEYYRLKNHYSATWQAYGFGPFALPSTGLDLGYFLNHQTLLFLEATTNIFGSGEPLDSSVSVRASSYGIHLKRFFGNSFYVRGGVDYRTANYNDSYSYNYDNGAGTTSYSYLYQFAAGSVAASLAIGNQWQWSHFTLGCDWIGIVKPFATNYTNEVTLASDGPAYTSNYYEHRFGSDVLPELLRLYLGASF